VKVISEWLLFEDRGLTPSGKTSIWAVIGRQTQTQLGLVKWAAPWRRYAFFPAPGCQWLDAICLRDIAAFCDEAMAERRTRSAIR
jgi:hypothetical protein